MGLADAQLELDYMEKCRPSPRIKWTIWNFGVDCLISLQGKEPQYQTEATSFYHHFL